MRIPKKVKIGGRIYKVKITENIKCHRSQTSAEIDAWDSEIRITPQSKETMLNNFLHELMHGIFDFWGKSDHDEELIDKMANTLYMIVKDNPQIFKGD